LTAVTFAHRAPRDTSAYSHAFGTRVRFSGSENAISFPRSNLDFAVVGADPRLAAVLERYAEERLAALTRDVDLRAGVKRFLTEHLSAGDCSTASIARAMNMSTRTLNRRLRDLGTTAHALLDEVRRAQAARLAEQRELSRKEIARVLGFSDTSALRKAWKRWMHTQPPCRPGAARFPP
jgi:AraC-like DNA-binding protein